MVPAAWTDLHADQSATSDANTPAGPCTLLGSVFDLLHACKVVDSLLRKEERYHAIPDGFLADKAGSALRTNAMGKSEHRGTNGDDHAAGPDNRQDRLPAVKGHAEGGQP